MPHLVTYCRAGFERESAEELSARFDLAPQRAEANSAYVVATGDGAAAHAPRDLHRLIFARQALIAFAHLPGLPRQDRLPPLMAALQTRDERYCDAWVEAPDSDSGKALAPFCRSFGNALIGALKKAQRLDPRAPRRLHAFFPSGEEAWIGTTDPAHSAPWPQGIPRLKFPREAPSRSTLKLDEAFLVL